MVANHPLVAHGAMTDDRFAENAIKDYILKMRNFDHPNPEDIFLDKTEQAQMHAVVNRLKRIQHTVGYGNFHLIGFDQAIKISKDYSKVGCFSKAELDFMDSIFHRNAADYGFLDKKPLSGLTENIDIDRAIKIHGTGNFLYKGAPLETYQKIKADLGDKVILTSGIRGVVKQFLLFLNKTKRSQSNLSLASRSLAPPGYSFHSLGDFDVGQVNFGVENFTNRFTTSEVYRNLIDFGYANLRYKRDNMLGVRFEPWHIKLNTV